MGKEQKTNTMRILDKEKIPYQIHNYTCTEFIDGITVAKALNQPLERTFKTLTAQGKSKNYYVFVLPVAEELDLKKAAHAADEKSMELLHVKDILAVTGYIRGGCTSIGMKKQYPVFLHQSAADFDTVFVSGGRLGTQIELAPQDLLKAARGVLADIIRQEQE